MSAQPVGASVDRDPTPAEWLHMSHYVKARWRRRTGRQSPFPEPSRRTAPTVAELVAVKPPDPVTEPDPSPWDDLMGDVEFWRAMAVQAAAYGPAAPKGWRRCLGLIEAGAAELVERVECPYTDADMADADRARSAHRRGGAEPTVEQVAAYRAYKRLAESARRRRLALGLAPAPVGK